MPRYKDLLQQQKKTQKDLFEVVYAADPRVDKPLINKMVNGICLPTPKQIEVICKFLNCEITELYSAHELLTIPVVEATKPINKRVREPNEFNLNVRIRRDLVNKVFSKENLKKLGYPSMADAIRSFVKGLEKQLDRLDIAEKKETS